MIEITVGGVVTIETGVIDMPLAGCRCELCQGARRGEPPRTYFLEVDGYTREYCYDILNVIPYLKEFPEGDTKVSISISGPITSGDYMADIVGGYAESDKLLSFDKTQSNVFTPSGKLADIIDVAFDVDDKVLVEITECTG